GIRARYLHADVSTLERMDIINDLRAGKFDVLVGINLLREGLDIPEVSLVAILDADKEGFLRSARSLIQICGRASRNVGGMVIMYADNITKSMKQAIDETSRRRKIQKAFNKKNNIIPTTIKKNIMPVFASTYGPEDISTDKVAEALAAYESLDNIDDIIKSLEEEMTHAAKELEFERAGELRDQIRTLKKIALY
ncbi:MAG: helicase-related protein, partial [Thermodesulfobacteriota bacterium]|nr:helicase-related protein [Thermodesulfobacteriota bacterium]